MQRNYCFLIIALVMFMSSCSSVNENWQEVIPEDAPLVVIPEENIYLRDIGNLPQISLLDDITPGNVNMIARVEDGSTTSANPRRLPLVSMFLYPKNSSSMEPVWITQGEEDYVSVLSQIFFKPFTESSYSFNGLYIHKLYMDDNVMFALQLGQWIFISPSSYAIEQIAKVALGLTESLAEVETMQKGDFLINVPHLNTWAKQLAKVIHHPGLNPVLKGSTPTISSFRNDETNVEIEFSYKSSFQVENKELSSISKFLTTPNENIYLDEHISSNAAAFAILRNKPDLLPKGSYEGATSLDSLLLNDQELYRELAVALRSEFALVTFAESGLSNTGEYLYLRHIDTPNSFTNDINQLERAGYITKQGSSYFIQSSILSRLIGSDLSDLSDFYLSFSKDVVAIARRKGLAESVNSDRLRRRVMYYEDSFSGYKELLPETMSGLVWIKSTDFLYFIEPYLNTLGSLTAILSQFDVASIQFSSSGTNTVNFEINTLRREESNLPYQELWVFPLPSTELSSEPILADVAGSAREEVLFATKGGSVYALATDGTQVFQLSTGTDEPIGQPILYDWYGNNQKVIIQAAGNKIYAWNTSGNLLPKFPFELAARISAPISIEDVLRNGSPEIIVATEDRRLHVLNGRGTNIQGWPQLTNTPIQYQPVMLEVNDEYSIWAVSSNSVHSWYANGSNRRGFPQFVQAPFTYKVQEYKDRVVVPTADGSIYSFGLAPLFEDSLSVLNQIDTLYTQQINIAETEITALQINYNTLLRDTISFFREDVFISNSLDGSVLIHNEKGKLRFSQSTGQVTSKEINPFVTDINSDRVNETFALAGIGRLYAWEILTEERVFNLPTSSMSYPMVADINNDGLKELIALTNEGLRCWTIRKQE